MRCAVVSLLLAAIVVADGRDKRGVRLTEEQRADVVRLVGDKAWGEMATWRQDLVCARYGRYLGAPERKQDMIRERGIRVYLLQTRGKPESQRLPPPLREAVDGAPRRLRPFAAKLAFDRMRQLRLDRGLRRVPFEKRMELFRRIFPEPFDQEVAKKATSELRRYENKAVAASLKKAMQAREREWGRDEQKRFVHEAVKREEHRLFDRVAGELKRLQRLDAERARRFVELQEFSRLVTPRQRELLRYAIRPEECPLLDLAYLGPKPEAPAERRLWEQDFRVLARMQLLFEAGFNREMVLHLAGTGSPEDLMRAVRALRRK